MSENKMAEVAKLLGVEFGEEFDILDSDGGKLKYPFHITADGLYFTTNMGSLEDDTILGHLLTGKYQIKKKPWKAKDNTEFYMPDINAGDEDKRYFVTHSNEWAYKQGLMCRTEEQAKELAKLLIKTARKFQGFDDDE